MISYLSTAYLAPVEYYARLYRSEKVIIEAHENFIKQSYRSRCFIGSANEIQTLSIPVVSNNGEKCPITEIRLSDHGNWKHLHWHAIKSAYNNTPFYEYYEDDFQQVFEKDFEYLFDFNEALRQLICRLLEIEPRVEYSQSYLSDEEIAENAGIDNLREMLHPKKDYHLADPTFKDVEYYQIFKEKWGFRPNLSILDLLFNMGPESIFVLRKSFQD